jgi:hypothetical protein
LRKVGGAGEIVSAKQHVSKLFDRNQCRAPTKTRRQGELWRRTWEL